MSTIRMMEARMPPGFRFHPRDDELVLDYLLHKLAGRGQQHTHTDTHGTGVAMVDVDLNRCEPWELPEESGVGEGNEWYFFSLHDRKYTTGDRTNRATRSGYWKATGKDRAVLAAGADEKVVGMRKTLVFYTGRAPKGRKTDWVMHEFRLHPRFKAAALISHRRHHHCDHLLIKEDWVLCRVFYRSRTTVPRPPPSQDQPSDMPSRDEPELPPPPAAAPSNSIAPLIAAYAFDGGSRTAAEQVSCFSGVLPTVPFTRPVTLGDLLSIDTSEIEAMGIMIGGMGVTSMINSGLEVPPSWDQENALAQVWKPL